jgi:hypothetical protein
MEREHNEASGGTEHNGRFLPRTLDDRDTLAVCNDGCLQPWDAKKMIKVRETEGERERERVEANRKG